MTLKEIGNIKHIEFNSEEERKKYIDWLEYTQTEYYVLSDGVSYGDNGTVWFLNIVEQLFKSTPIFNAERWL